MAGSALLLLLAASQVIAAPATPHRLAVRSDSDDSSGSRLVRDARLALAARDEKSAAGGALLPAAMWVWGGKEGVLNQHNETAMADLKRWLHAQNAAGNAANTTGATPVRQLLVESTSTDDLLYLWQSTKAETTRPSLLYGWVGSDMPQSVADDVRRLTANVLQFAKEYNPDTVGISLDIEPSGTPAYQQYADLLAEIRKTIDQSPMASKVKLSIAASWALSLHNVTCSTYDDTASLWSQAWTAAAGGASMSLRDCAIRKVDLYVLMNYRNSAYGCFCRPDGHNNPAYGCPADGSPVPESCPLTSPPGVDGMIGKALDTAQAIKAAGARARLSLGLETSCFPASDPADREYQYKLSFCGTSIAYMNAQRELTARYFAGAGLWDNVFDAVAPWAIEDYKAVRALQGDPI